MKIRTRKDFFGDMRTYVSIFIVLMAQIYNSAIASSFSEFGEIRFAGATTGIIRDVLTIDGEIYVGAENGLFSIVGANSRVFDYKNSPLGNGIISDIRKANDGGLWIAEYGSGVYHYNPSNYDFRAIYTDNAKIKYAWAIAETEKYLIISTITGLLVVEKASNKIISEVNSIEGQEIADVYSLTTGPDNAVYFVFKNTIHKISSSLDISKVSENEKLWRLDELSEITSFKYIEENGYVAGPEGVYILDNRDVRFVPLASELTLPYGIEDIYKGQDGTIWLAGGGLFKLDFKRNKIVKPTFLNPFVTSPSIESITSISETANGELLLGSSQRGLVVIPKLSTSFNYFSIEDKPFNGNIKDIALVNKEAYVKTTSGVYKLDSRKGVLTEAPLEESKYNCFVANSAIESKATRVSKVLGDFCKQDAVKPFILQKGTWVYTEQGNEHQLTEIKGGEIVDKYKVPGEVSQVVSTSGDDLLVATDDGKLYIQHSRATWKEVLLFSARTSQINCLIEGQSQTVWICTSGGGVLSLNLDNYEVSTQHHEALRAYKFVRGGVRLNERNILFTSNRGAFVFDEVSKTAQTLDATDGIDDVDFEYSGAFELDDYRVAIVGDNYSYIFDERTLIEKIVEKKGRKSDVELLEVSAINGSGESFLVGASFDEETSKVNVRGLMDRITVKLSSSNYTAQSDQQIEYRVLGLYDEWRAFEKSEGLVIIEPADSGVYQLQARVIDSRSTAVQDITSLKVTVYPPLLLSWYAFYLYGIVLLGIAYLFRDKYREKLSEIFHKALVKSTGKKELARDDLLALKRDIEKKQKMFSDISHEMKSPVMLIRGPLQDIRANPRDDQANKKRIEIALNQADKLQYLANQIIQIEQLESVTKLPRKPVQVKECIEGLGIQMQALTDFKSQVLDVSINGDAVLILIEDSLEKMVINLVTNASKYSDAKTMIKVRVRVDEETVTVRVIDEGVGICEKDFESVFQRFNQLKTTAEEGSGIGLAMVRELARANGGEVEVKSKEGEGSTFTLTLPVTCPEAAACAEVEWVPVADGVVNEIEQEQELLPPVEADKPLVLIVDDNRDMRFYLCNIFEPFYTCVTARNGQHAIDVLQVCQPDLIVSDLEMPELDGVGLAKHVKHTDSHNLIPFIMLTAHEDKELRSSAWEQEIDDYISKPFNSDELLIKVRNILNNRSKISEFIEQQQEKDLRKTSKDIPQFSSRKDMEFYTNFLAVIEKNYQNEKWGRADAAGLLLISERQLNRKVSELFGSSFTEYLRNHRLNKAGVRLASGEQITNVAYGVGFGTPSYFSSCFKQKFGKSPKGYQDDAIEKSPVTE